MADKQIIINLANNFDLIGRGPMPTDPVVIKSPYTRYDYRVEMLTTDLDLSNWDWYYNYINSMRHFAHQNPDVYATFMLDVGYVPVIFLPIDTVETIDPRSVALQHQPILLSALIRSKIPYTSMSPMTFTKQRISYSNVTDCWVSKMDAAKFINKAPEAITAFDVIDEVIKYVK